MALSLMDSLLFYQSKVAKDIIVESVTKAQRDFYADREVLQKDKSNFLRHTLIDGSYTLMTVPTSLGV